MDTVLETTSRSRRTLDPKPATPVLFAHFVLRSSNIQPMIDWYSAVLNMHVVQRTDYICFLTYDDEHHRLGIVNLAGLAAPDASNSGLAHVAYTFADIGALLSTYARVKKLGIAPSRCIHHGPTVSIYYRDPDGNGVELQVDRYATKEATAAYFQTAAFRKNPIGVAFDPEALVQAYEAGAPEAELLEMPEGPPAPGQSR
ncbi:MAG: biphenyl 2,3-dioxygenase [Reyranella sp.]|uniref:VOC family protein n=1 Tax=Reyranella sp. TaxID=1929291 RepID=UPI0012107D9E|nr:VOC family protein [Reyranella sp.]TAJ41264.1 MAG: biphenyl 2,3-dioxygenase [Reyranella sp.]